MLKTLLLVTTFLFVNLSFGQTSTFVPGWCIIEKGASYSNYGLMNLESGSKETYDEESHFALKVGEPVFATEFSQGVYYCYYPTGVPFLIKGTAPLTKTKGLGVGVVVSGIRLPDGDSLKSGRYVWVVKHNEAKFTFTINLANQKVLEIPINDIVLLSDLIHKNSKSMWFKEAE
jgi:hypothetical protein